MRWNSSFLRSLERPRLDLIFQFRVPQPRNRTRRQNGSGLLHDVLQEVHSHPLDTTRACSALGTDTFSHYDHIKQD